MQDSNSFIHVSLSDIKFINCDSYIVCSRATAGVANLTNTDSDCQLLETAGYTQNLFVKIGKYAIIILAAWNLLREVGSYKSSLNL